MLSNAFKLFQAPSSGKDAISIVLTTEHYAVTCDKTGVPKSGELGAVLNGFIDPSATGRCYTKVSVYRGSTMLVKGLDWEWGADWDYSLHIGWAYSKPVNPPDTGAFGDTVYITQLNADSGYLGLKINVGGSIYTKYFRFNKLKDGQTGADSYSVVLTNETQVVACNSDGSLKAGELDRAVTDIQVYKGNTQLAWNVDWVIDETIFSGACFSAYMSSIKLSYFENDSISGTCEIGIMIGTIYIYKTFSVTKVIDVPVPFTTKEPWSSSSIFQNGQYLRYEGKVYIWSYPYPGNSALNPKDDIINNPITTHWKGYEIWELVATDLLLSRLIKAEEIDVDSLFANRIVSISGTFNGSISAPFKELSDVEVVWNNGDSSTRIGHINLYFNTGFNFAYAASAIYMITLNLPSDIAYEGVFSDLFNKPTLTKSGGDLSVSGNFIYRGMTFKTIVNKVTLKSNAILNLRAIVMYGTLYWYVQNSNEFTLSGTVLSSN